MKNEPGDSDPSLGRRAFLRSAAWSSGVVGLGGLAGYALNRSGEISRATKPKLGAEFSYDVSRFQTSDPALKRYDEVIRYRVGIESARCLAVGEDGLLYLGGDEGIQVVNGEGRELASIRLDRPVQSLAVKGSERMLVGQKGRILVLDPDGRELEIWDDFPEDMLPTSIDVSESGIHVADAANRVVRKLNGAGESIGIIDGRSGDLEGVGFKVPSPYFCLKMGDDGLLRVTNPGAHRIETYLPDGRLELAWGRASFAIEAFCGCCNPVSFDIFPDGSYVTCEKGLPRVKLYDGHGVFTGMVAGPEDFPEYLSVVNAGARKAAGAGIQAVIDPAGRILILDAIAQELRVMVRKEGSDE
ncbi:hypothetical protein [Haloferula sp.]|uniref:hypothetical protein n=1 Tax=Haloferula sp. TaxID=2497595 RepID=UPI003C73BE2A